MGYYTRVFCISSKIPSLTEISNQLQAVNKNCRIELGEENQLEEWESFSLYYKDEKLPLFVQLNKRDDDDDLANEEIEEFIDAIGAPLFSLSKRKVINHLMKTKYVVASQLPTTDIDDDGYDLNGALLQIFAIGYDGMVQADNEGFYIGNNLILEDR